MGRAAAIALLAILALASPGLCAAETAPGVSGQAEADAGGFVRVDTRNLDAISGKSLAVAAYAIILGALLVYAVSLVTRERAIEKRADALRASLPKK